MSRIKEWWTSLSPKHRKTTVSIGVLAAMLLILYLFISAGPDQQIRNTANTELDKNLLTGSDPKDLGLDALGTNIKNNKSSIKDLQAGLNKFQDDYAKDNQQLLEQIKQLRQALESVRVDTHEKIGSFEQRQRSVLSDFKNNPGSKEEVKPGTVDPAEAQQRGLFEDAEVLPAVQPDAAGRVDRSQANELIKVRVFGENKLSAEPDDIDSHSQVYLPAGSILSGVLITGVDAPTGLQSKTDPMPALIRLKHDAILPNHFKMDIRECFLVVGTTGDLSTERAFMRGESLSCIRNDGGVIEVNIDTYVVGEDGKAGMRGRLVSRNGSLVAKGAAAGFLEGLSNIYRPVAIQGLQTDPGSDTLFQQPDTSEALEAAGYSGFGGAMRRLADYYIDMADQIVPFIEIDAGRKIENVLLSGVTLDIRT